MPPLETIAGKYTVDRRLGEGGVGYVVLAHHPILGACAIKLLHPEHAKNPDVIARFLREAQAVQKIQSEHVVRVSDVGIDPETSLPFMVMERLEGDDLSQVLERHGQLAVDVAIDYALQACEALTEAHAEGIVHRDLKPSNLFLTKRRDGSPFVKVLDFGISKLTSPESPALTRSGGIVGTVLYMSPEQLQRPKEVDARSDVWALGVILYELLSGRVPFLGEDIPNTIVKILMEEPAPLGSLRPDVPAGLALVVARCLRKDREQRFPHIADFAAGLQPFAPSRSRVSVERISGVLAAAGAAVSADASGSYAARPAGAPTTANFTLSAASAGPVTAGRLALVAAGAALVALGVAGGILATRRGAEPRPAEGALVPLASPPRTEASRSTPAEASSAPVAATPSPSASSMPPPPSSSARPQLAARPSNTAGSAGPRPAASAGSRAASSAPPARPTATRNPSAYEE